MQESKLYSDQLQTISPKMFKQIWKSVDKHNFYELSRRKGNDQEPVQSNSTFCSRHQTGKEHK